MQLNFIDTDNQYQRLINITKQLKISPAKKSTLISVQSKDHKNQLPTPSKSYFCRFAVCNY